MYLVLSTIEKETKIVPPQEDELQKLIPSLPLHLWVRIVQDRRDI